MTGASSSGSKLTPAAEPAPVGGIGGLGFSQGQVGGSGLGLSGLGGLGAGFGALGGASEGRGLNLNALAGFGSMTLGESFGSPKGSEGSRALQALSPSDPAISPVNKALSIAAGNSSSSKDAAAGSRGGMYYSRWACWASRHATAAAGGASRTSSSDTEGGSSTSRRLAAAAHARATACAGSKGSAAEDCPAPADVAAEPTAAG